MDLQAAEWRRPAERMEAGREHRVPLSPAAMDTLERARSLDSSHVKQGRNAFSARGPTRVADQLQVPLASFMPLLVTNVRTDPRFIQTDRADAVAGRPEMEPRHAALPKQLPVNLYRTLALQEADRVRDAVLRRNAQEQVQVVDHRFTFDQLHASLLAQFPQILSDPTPQPPVEHLPPVLRNDDHATANAHPPRRAAGPRAPGGLIETSPVGVMVCEARTGALVSINQEARRIVDGLRRPAAPRRSCWR